MKTFITAAAMTAFVFASGVTAPAVADQLRVVVKPAPRVIVRPPVKRVIVPARCYTKIVKKVDNRGRLVRIKKRICN